MKTKSQIVEEAQLETLRVECPACHAHHAKVYETMFDCAIFKEAFAK